MFDHPRRYLHPLPGVNTPAIPVAQRGTFQTVQPASPIPVQGARPLGDPADVFAGYDPARVLGDPKPRRHRLRRLPPGEDIMEIRIWAEAGEIIGADGDLLEAFARKDTGHSAQPVQRVPCAYGERCEIDASSITNNAIDGGAHDLASAISVRWPAVSPIGQLCRRGD